MVVLIVAEPADDVRSLEHLCKDYDAAYRLWKTEWFHSRKAIAALQEFVNHNKADWIVHADSDELLREAGVLTQIIAEVEAEGAGYCRATMVDRLSTDGSLVSIKNIETLAELEASFPIQADVTKRIARACSYKACVSRWPYMGIGHHADRSLRKQCSRIQLVLDHYKWRDGLELRLRKRIMDHTRSQVPWGAESKRILHALSEHGRLHVAP